MIISLMPTLICENPNCRKFYNGRKDKRCKHNICSRSCSVTISNRLCPRNPGLIRLCAYCGKRFKSRQKYCSKYCKDLDQVVTKQEIINFIGNFYRQNGRIPYKDEYKHAHAARFRFGTWNNAIKTAGFSPNPLKFAKKYIANDGDKCDSLAEKIIDDYLFARRIKHIRNFPYPGFEEFTVDFKVGDFWIEFFGLAGQLESYDRLMKRKLKIVRNNNLKLIRIHPKDLFPVNRLSHFVPLISGNVCDKSYS
jgi:hypothetical protein